MVRQFKSKIYVLRSRTVRWMGAYLPAVGLALEAARDQVQAVQEYVPAGMYKGIVLAGVVALVLRVATAKPLSAYKDEGQGE